MISRRCFSLGLSGAVLSRAAWAQYGLKSCEISPTSGEMEIRNFSRYKITQGPDQCWAACIQMFLNYAGVQVNQSDLASIVQGSSSIAESATESDIRSALARRLGRFSNKVTQEPWNLDFLAIPEPAATVIQRYLCEQRPIIAVLETKRHVVVLYKAEFSIRQSNGGGVLHLENVTCYDPATDRDTVVDGNNIRSTISALWLLTASRPAQNVF